VSVPEAVPDTISPAIHTFTTRTVQIPMRDGVQLTATLNEPVGLPAGGPRACVMWNEGYVPPSTVIPRVLPGATARLEDFATRGYASLYLNLRGPTQEPDPGEGLYPHYADDGYDAVEWAAAQPWCDTVGLIGASLDGISAWLAASARPPHLAAIAPEIACGDCYWYLWNRGGTIPGAGRAARVPPVTATNEYGAAVPHRTYDPWWEERNTNSFEHLLMAWDDIPVMQCGGWDDYITPGGMKAIEQINRAGGDGMNIIGPCSHGEVLHPAQYDYQTYSVLWFDRWLKGIDNGYDRKPEALIWVEGANQYRYEEQWPPTDTHWSRLSLRSTPSGSAQSLNDGSLSTKSPGRDEPGVSYVHDPAGPFNNAGGGGIRPLVDQRGDERNSLTWTTAALSTPAEVTGWPRLQFWASSSAPDTDFVVEISEVAPDGTSKQISRGWLNAPQSLSRTSPRPLVPGQPYRFDMELWPLAHVVPAGSRIRVAVSGSDSPGTGVNPNPATVTILQDRNHRSDLLLPVIGTGWKSLEAANQQ
jgi:predicted acyl esterase